MPRNNVDKIRLSCFLPDTLYNRLQQESDEYGVTKTAIVQMALLNYYQQKDVCLISTTCPPSIWLRDKPPGGAAT